MNAGEVSRKSIYLVLSEPMLIVAELLWRWAFAVGAVGIVLFYSSIVRDAISLSAADQGALLSGNLLLTLDVLSRIITNALPFLLQAAAGALPKIALTWLVCITLGRSQLLRRVVEKAGAAPAEMHRQFWISMVVIHGVRVLLLLIVISAFLGASRMAGLVFGPEMKQSRILPAMAVYFLTFGIGITIYLVSNFIAALASLYVAKGRPALDAMADAVHASLRDRALLGATAASNATLRTFVATVVTGVSVLLLPLSRYVPASVLLVLAVILSVLYCAVSDVLLLARTMAYALIALGPCEVESSAGQAKGETPLYSAPPDLRS
jgi:hypothetical protein